MRPPGLLKIEDFPNLTFKELYEVMAECGSPGYYQLAVEELQRRYLINIGNEAKRLADSSEELESLTKRLKTLTWVLIFLTALAAIVPIGIEICKAFSKH